MTAREHPIIFSASMIRALLAGRKTQTRRLASSPLAKVEAGDRFWVRESFRGARGYDAIRPKDWGNKPIWYEADGEPDKARWWHLSDKARPAIHMPRWASRLTLEVTAVRVELLQEISEADARAEGLKKLSKDQGRTWKWGVPEADGVPGKDGQVWTDWNVDPRKAFAALWDSLHTKPGTRWEDNPAVAAIAFKVLP